MAYQRSAMMQERLADNRQRIVLAARRVIALGGLRGASMNAVATEAGLSIGAIYRYFPSKAGLFVEVLNDAVTREVEILDALVAKPELSARACLRACVISFAERALEGPNLAYAFIAEPAESEVDAERILCRQQFSDVFRRIVKRGVASGEFPAQPLDVSAACIVGAFTEALVRPVAPQIQGQSAKLNKAGDRRLVASIADFCERAVAGQDPPVVKAARLQRRV